MTIGCLARAARARRVAAACMVSALWMAALDARGQASHRPDPSDPGVSVPALRYDSPLWPPYGVVVDRPDSWREANDRVARIGGWRAYAREAQAPAAAASAGAAHRH